MSDGSEKKFLSRRDIDIRLNGCLVKYEGKYYRVGLTEDREDSVVTNIRLMDVTTGRYIKEVLDANSGVFQYQFYNSIGWMPPHLNKDHFCISSYVARAPYRRYKAGLAANCLNQLYDGAERNPYRDGLSQSFVEEARFLQMLENEYPSFIKVKKFVSSFEDPFSKSFIKRFGYDGKFVNVGLSRDWAIRYTHGVDGKQPTEAILLFGLFPVGKVNLETDMATFDTSYNNSFHWEKFSEVFMNRISIQTGM